MAKTVRVRVKRVAIDPEKRCLVTVGTLKRDLPIWIGPGEGQAIALVLQGKALARPMTHDLFVNALAELGWKIDKLVIADLRECTFYGELHVSSGRKRKVLDCRPSDGMALAVRVKAPIYVAEHVLEQALAPPPTVTQEPVVMEVPAEPTRVKRSGRKSRPTSA